MINVFVYGGETAPIVLSCLCVIRRAGATLFPGAEGADLAIAPLLTRRLTWEDLEKPKIGTLVLHPSLLPRHRGPDAIKWAMRSGEPYSGITWFWADCSYDHGPICEQAVTSFRPGETAREYYERAVIPAAALTLGYALEDIIAGHIRKRPQNHAEATYEPKISRR